MNDLILLIGGNQGNRIAFLKEATQKIAQQIGSVFIQSHVYETAPWGISEQPTFYNQALWVKTELLAEDVMAKILMIEEKMGRIRSSKNGPRTIDIDILYYNQDIIDQENLEIPHPRIADRKFVLTPLFEICPDWIDPTHNKSIQNLLVECKDNLAVEKLSPDCV